MTAILKPASQKADSVGRPELNFRNRQAQAGQKQLVVLGVSQKARIRDHDGADRTQPCDYFSRLGEPSHMRVAGSKIAIGYAKAGIPPDGEEQIRRCLID